MEQVSDENIYPHNSLHSNIHHLKPQCEKCFGLCCVALYFSVQDGFPTNKIAGDPCPNLDANFRCTVHEKLKALGLKGCIAYECFGAGQQVSQVTFDGRDWRMEPSSADLMFEVFLIVRQLHELCWYLTEALSFKLPSPLSEELEKALSETERITRFTPHSLMEFDLTAHRTKLNVLLRNTSKHVQSKMNLANKATYHADKERKSGANFFGKDLRKKDLRCADLRGACLIAANLEGTDLSGTDFIGADFRDANLKGANLSRSIFLTQSQVNAAKGNDDTTLPSSLSRPEHWIIKGHT